MKRLIVRIGLLFVGASLVGCGGDHSLRPKSEDPVSHKDDETKINDVEAPAPKGFFKNSRLSGALSDEGREIERDFGIR